MVVLLSEDLEGDAAKLESLAKKHAIKNTPLTIFDGVAGPPAYKIAKEADVTVVMWANKSVENTHAYRKGGLNKTAIAKVVADAKKVFTIKPKAEPKRKPKRKSKRKPKAAR